MKSVLIILLSFYLLGCITYEQENSPKLNSDPIEKAESRITLGLGYLKIGNMVKAKENLEKALQYTPEHYRAMLAIAHYYDMVGETEKAQVSYDNALNKHSDNGQVLNNYGAFLCKKGEFRQADQYFNQAIAQPNYYLIAESYENAGLCAIKYGDLHRARQYFSRAVGHDPQRFHSILQLSKLEIDSGELSKARERLMQFHLSYGYKKASLLLLASLERRTGNSELEQKYLLLLKQQ
ncbi:type IV pilus biogenesis/stability protein PilW [Vibrio ziniensis]|uniref:Type IV pilus biogenesis/stability protein PilW n=1 Tax=Vibrio ziniensis TaxID=2711221 RepID=A0A6G7CHK1_9VIBR|nr:type IV pilus biogenesis/stability protein PilW [Vibrio ziniensis]QIH41587.1 type IV pilus biogenesis/stability protein PilW [Vibrio ziniensis]